ncbi:hypothetical protein Tco_1269847, partial [Tanacetum coccineum]
MSIRDILWLIAVDGLDVTERGYQGRCLERLYIARHFIFTTLTVSTTSIPTPPPPTPPPPPPPITRQRPANLHQNPKQRVPYNPSANHATVLPTTITEPTSFTAPNNSPEWRQAMKEDYDALMKNGMCSLVPRAKTGQEWCYHSLQSKICCQRLSATT